MTVAAFPKATATTGAYSSGVSSVELWTNEHLVFSFLTFQMFYQGTFLADSRQERWG
jgi:hypothetical protein